MSQLHFLHVLTELTFFNVRQAKLFMTGHIRKNIEYATACNSALQDTIVDINFSGVTPYLTSSTLISSPILGINESAESSFLSDTNPLNAGLDKFFFQNLAKFNEQPFGELVAANFFELDFATAAPNAEGIFNTVTEKLVLELTVKVLQLQQLQISLLQSFLCFLDLPLQHNRCSLAYLRKKVLFL